MIFVLVGTHEQPFDRLLRHVDDLASAGMLPDDLFCQTGFSTYEPRHAQWERMLPFEETQRLTREASVVITHGGPGCILPALAAARPLVLVPRRHRFGEHVDDHQVAFCRRVAAERGVPVVEDITRLGPAIEQAYGSQRRTDARLGDGAAAAERLASRVDSLLTTRPLPGTPRIARSPSRHRPAAQSGP